MNTAYNIQCNRGSIHDLISIGKTRGEHELYSLFLDSPDLTFEAKKQLMAAWKRIQHNRTNQGEGI